MTDLFEDTRAQAPARTMKAISLWQPWASLMAAGVKIDETRHWPTSHRGPTAIHAAKTFDPAGAPEQLCQDLFGPYWMEELPRGMVVAVGDLVRCSPAQAVADRLTAANRASGNFAHGRYAWRFDNIRRLRRPLPLVGRQGLFNWTPPADLDAQLCPPIDHLAACAAIGWN